MRDEGLEFRVYELGFMLAERLGFMSLEGFEFISA